MEMLMSEERKKLSDFSRRMLTEHLTVGTSGNLSIRKDDLIAITPSGVPYDRISPEDICVITLAGDLVDGHLEPSSEIPMHTSVYGQTVAQSVVHTHSVYATAVSCVIEELPPIHYMCAYLGGPVRVVPYALFGSAELASNCVKGLDGRYGVLLQNHGATTLGASIESAFSRSLYLEWMCQVYREAQQMGRPHLLNQAELDMVATRLTRYGQSAGRNRMS